MIVTRTLLKFNHLIWKTHSNVHKIARFGFTTIMCVFIGILLVGGIATRTVGMAMGVIILLSQGLYAFGVDGEKDDDNV